LSRACTYHLCKTNRNRIHRSEGDNAAPGQPTGPLALVLRTAPHPRFTSRGSDLVHHVKLPLYNALVGGTVPVQMLDGRWVHGLVQMQRCCLE